MMQNQPKVSVIMPSLNVVEYIRECMESVIQQTLQEIEIICVDAGSTDGTLEILREYEEKDQRVKVLISPKRSYGYQMNMGMDAATGEYMGIVETDDYILPNMYEDLYDVAHKNDLDFVKSDFKKFGGDGVEREFVYQALFTARNNYNKILNPRENLALFSGEKLNQIGLYCFEFIKKWNIRFNQTPGASFQDNGFWFQNFMYAQNVYFVNKAYYMLRRDNPNSSVHNFNSRVLCMSEEYDAIRQIIRNGLVSEEKYAPICARYRFGNYEFTLNNLSDDKKLDYIRRMSQDMRWIEDHHELQKDLYSTPQWNKLQEIMRDPDEYYYGLNIQMQSDEEIEQGYMQLLAQNQQLRKQVDSVQKEIRGIRASVTYRIGRIITFIPRMIHGGFQCCKDNGLRYTWYRFFEKLTFSQFTKKMK